MLNKVQVNAREDCKENEYLYSQTLKQTLVSFQNNQNILRSCFLMKMNHFFPEDVLDYIFNFLESNRDRNAVSLVCKYWYKVESSCRKKVIIRNCYALSPSRLIFRFPKIKALTLKGYPHVDGSDSIPQTWGGFAHQWIEMLAESCSSLEELKLKRMVVTDETLELISHSFPNFKSLVLIHCRGYTSNGLAAIVANCRFLEVLDLHGNVVTKGGHWLDCFPESFTSLVSLNFTDDLGEVDLVALEKLVGRCPNLKSLKLSKAVPLGTLVNILVQAPQLVDLGIGSFTIDPNSETYMKLYHAVLNCKLVCNLSGFLNCHPTCLPAIIPICSNLIFLNLRTSYNMRAPEFIMLISECRKLQRLWILDCIGDKGLEVVASTCKELQELRIYASLSRGRGTPSENGMISISMGCPKLHSLQYVCLKMTNAALATVATNCPNLIRFSLHILHSKKPDYVTTQPFDEGFGAIVHSCKKLKHLSLSGILTDQVFLYMGMYAEQLQTLTVEFSGESDTGILYLLNGCSKLRKLVIRNSPIGDAALLAAADKYERLQFFWMSSCNVTLEGCKALAKKVSKLNIEMLKDGYCSTNADDVPIGKIYMYRSLDGPRNDAPVNVCTLDELV